VCICLGGARKGINTPQRKGKKRGSYRSAPGWGEIYLFAIDQEKGKGGKIVEHTVFKLGIGKEGEKKGRE